MSPLQQKPILHGRDHCPGGADPIPCFGDFFPPGGEVIYADYVLELGPIGYWRLGETGEPWVDSTADDNDMEIEDHGVALTPDVTGALPDSQDDGAVQFNYAGIGGSSSADYLTTGAPSPLNSLFQLGSMTVAAFVKVAAYPGVTTRGYVAGSQVWTGSVFSGWAIHIAPDGDILFTRGDVSGTEEYARSPGPLVVDDWYHVAGTYDYATGEIELYLNGTLVDTTAGTDSVTTGETNGVHVGHLALSPNNLWFTGSLDELAVWDIVLTAEQIALLASASVATTTPAGYVLTSDGLGGVGYAAPTIEVEF